MMREFFLLVLILGLCAALEDTPVQEVTAHNIGIAPSMANNSGIELENFTKDDPVQVGMEIVTVLPAVDGRIPPETDGVLWGYNEEYIYQILYDDGDGCPDKYTYHLRNSSGYAEMRFRFRNETLGGEIALDEPIIEIPFSSSILESANGSENLTIELVWVFWHYFEKTVKINNPDMGGCDYEVPTESMVNITSIGNVSAQYLVEPGNVSFFLLRPVLGEQWHQNNHFDTLAFSRKSIYKAEIGLDGNESGYARIYNFSIVEDSLGVWHTVVNETEVFENASMENYEIEYWANPVVRENNSFSHLYEVNYTYVGVGAHALNVTVTDFFGEKYSFEKEIFSRKMTFEGKSEEGTPAGDVDEYRPSAPAIEEGEIRHNLIPSNEYLMMFLVAGIGIFWYYKGSGKSR